MQASRGHIREKVVYLVSNLIDEGVIKGHPMCPRGYPVQWRCGMFFETCHCVGGPLKCAFKH